MRPRIKNKGLTLVEVLVAMIILATSAAGVMACFSYSFKFTQRAGKKVDAMYLSRKTLEAYRAMWLADSSDTRLACCPNVMDSNIDYFNQWLRSSYYGHDDTDCIEYGGVVSVTIEDVAGWNPADPSEVTKRITVNAAGWDE